MECRFDFAYEDLRGDKDVVTAAVTQNVEALEHASVELQGDPTVKYLCNEGVHRLMESSSHTRL